MKCTAAISSAMLNSYACRFTFVLAFQILRQLNNFDRFNETVKRHEFTREPQGLEILTAAPCAAGIAGNASVCSVGSLQIVLIQIVYKSTRITRMIEYVYE